MDNEMNPMPPDSPAPSQGQGQPTGPNTGGGNNRRRRRRRGRKPGRQNGSQQMAGNSANQDRPPHRGPRHQRPGGQPNQGGTGRQRQNRGRMRRGGPQFVGPMDHSYRATQPDLAGGFDQNRPRRQVNGNGYAPVAQDQPEYVPPSPDAPARIFCFIEDLFFFAKIQEVSRKLGVKVEFVKTAEPVLDRAADEVPEDERPSLIIFDLNNANVKPLTLIPKLRAKLKKSASIIGFVSHIQGDLKLKAQEAGCDMVVPRSAFSQNLPNLLRRHSGSEAEYEG